MHIKTFRSAFSGEMIHFVDYNHNASVRAKNKLYKEICDKGLLEYFLNKRPDIIKDMTH